MQHRRTGALIGVEVGIAGGERQAVGLPHGRQAADLDRNVEIAHQALDRLELLVILLAEQGDIGLSLHQQLDDDRRHPGEVAWPELVLETCRRRPVDTDQRRETRRVHAVEIGREDQIGTGRLDHRAIALEVARIGRKVLVGGELLGVDEDRHDHPVGDVARRRDERHVAGVERAHRRDEGDPLAAGAPGGDMLAQQGNFGAKAGHVIGRGVGLVIGEARRLATRLSSMAMWVSGKDATRAAATIPSI